MTGICIAAGYRHTGTVQAFCIDGQGNILLRCGNRFIVVFCSFTGSKHHFVRGSSHCGSRILYSIRPSECTVLGTASAQEAIRHLFPAGNCACRWPTDFRGRCLVDDKGSFCCADIVAYAGNGHGCCARIGVIRIGKCIIAVLNKLCIL